MNLKQHLPILLEQDYPSFEVIVVDDASDDGTHEYLISLAGKYANLVNIRLSDKTNPGKKNALQLGIANANYSFLLLTDADCMPNSKNWIKSHSMFADNKETVLLGYGKHQKQTGLLNKLIRFDTANIGIQYMSKALWKYPYMGVGRNIGYSKDLAAYHQDVNSNIASGDDDLFIQAIRTHAQYKVNLDPDSFTISEPKSSLKSWLIQKSRHSTTAAHYKIGTSMNLVFAWLIQACFYFGIITILLTNLHITGLIILLVHSLCLWLFNGIWLKKLGEKDLILFIPILNFIYIFVQPVFVLKSLGRKKDAWN